jgi:hypothetical protein
MKRTRRRQRVANGMSELGCGNLVIDKALGYEVGNGSEAGNLTRLAWRGFENHCHSLRAKGAAIIRRIAKETLAVGDTRQNWTDWI